MTELAGTDCGREGTDLANLRAMAVLGVAAVTRALVLVRATANKVAVGCVCVWLRRRRATKTKKADGLAFARRRDGRQRRRKPLWEGRHGSAARGGRPVLRGN
ncbi:hypothetical protein PYCCODRAFT_403306 [Trametes coccinea BRFM310]|uniref:Uncharacterized protein n=1 Tax=Trametes coccinea (strain BRFM310) TaxID=1353009 RepID=A0A1Y2IMW7_TRAC3|nr:hypothetical protein PYCCODRAFT_403306 [Trametes coccinea BRFM310]